MTIDSGTGVISWTPDDTQLGLNAVTVVASNGQSPDDTQSFDIDVAMTLIDDFNDNRRGAMWRIYVEDLEGTQVIEDANRLNITSPGGIDLTSICVGQWTMNDNADNTVVLDSSGNNNNGTARRNTSILHTDSGNPPYLNGALTFNRTDADYITTSMNNFPSGAEPRTVSTWVYRSSTTGYYQVIFGYGEDVTGYSVFGAFFDYLGNLYCWNNYFNNSYNFDTGIDIPLGQWTHIAFTYDGTDIRAYKNAELISTTARTLATGLEKSAMGGNTWGNSDYLTGAIDNFMIFDDVLSQEEISLLYNNSIEGREGIPDGSTGVNTADYSSNGWSLSTAEDFAVKVDFHYSDLSDGDGWAGITVGDSNSYVSISAGSDSNESYFYYEAIVDGNTISEKELRMVDDGTLYVSYNAALNDLYLSTVGFGSEDAYNWSTTTSPIAGQWTDESVTVSIGGGTSSAVDSGEAYLDDLTVLNAELFGWPVVTDIDGDGYVDAFDLGIMADNWLMTDVGLYGGDINGNGQSDGIINFLDFAELGLAW
jgi:hypothetical protein